jgi:hypothetical protein
VNPKTKNLANLMRLKKRLAGMPVRRFRAAGRAEISGVKSTPSSWKAARAMTAPT